MYQKLVKILKGRRKGKMGKWRGKEENVRRKLLKKADDCFFFSFFFCCSLLGINWNFFGVHQNGNFYRENAKIMPRKNQEPCFRHTIIISPAVSFTSLLYRHFIDGEEFSFRPLKSTLIASVHHSLICSPDEGLIWSLTQLTGSSPHGVVLSIKAYPEMCRWNGSQNEPPGITMTPHSGRTWYKHGSYFQTFSIICTKLAQFHFINLMPIFPKFAWKFKNFGK